MHAEGLAAKEELQKAMRSALRKYRATLDAALMSLRESNAAMRTSLRAFSEGGNFCSEEIDEYRTVLQALGTRIDEAEGVVVAELDGMEAQSSAQAEEIMTAFLQQHTYATKDAAFVEDAQKKLRGAAVRMMGEQALSESKSKEIDDLLHHLGQMIDKQWDTNVALSCLDRLAKLFPARIAYLECGKGN